jgi:hypothetical protein
MDVQVPLEKPVSQSFGYIPKSGIAGSNGRSMSGFLSSFQIFFQSALRVLIAEGKRISYPDPVRPLLTAIVKEPVFDRLFLLVLAGTCWAGTLPLSDIPSPGWFLLFLFFFF